MRTIEVPRSVLEKLARAMCRHSGMDPEMMICPQEPVRVARIGGIGFLAPKPEHCFALWCDFVPAAEAALMVFGEVTRLEFVLVDDKVAAG